MSSLIKKIGEDLSLYTEKWAPCWVVNFPMFEKNSEGNLTSLHHPFTLPNCSIDELRKIPGVIDTNTVIILRTIR